LCPPALVVCGLIVAIAGCSSWRPEWPSEHSAAKTAGMPAPSSANHVRVESDGLALAQVEDRAVSPQEMLDTVASLLDQDKPAAARRFVQLYPDVAWDLLRNTTADDAEDDAVRAVAAAHDAQCTRGGPEETWTAYLQARAENPKACGPRDQRRRRFLVTMRGGEPEQALALGLGKTGTRGDGPLPAIDSGHLRGMALMLADRPAEAAEVFAEARRLAAEAHPYQAAYLGLLQSEALRRAGNTRQADATWVGTVRAAAALVGGERATPDPVFWQRAAYLRPVDKRWPETADRALIAACGKHRIGLEAASNVVPASADDRAAAARSELPVWACIGGWRLLRGEPDAALVALKRAEAMTTDEKTKQQLQLAEAKALLALEQQMPAAALLVQLGAAESPEVTRAAMATLGSAKLQSGNTRQGFHLLQQAIEEGEPLDWPGRAEAEADLGLAYLLMGDEPAGLRWLHRAQERFETAGDRRHLIQSLENELAYCRQAKKKPRAGEIETRLRQLEKL
jgi:hypothetical protein